MRERLRLVVPCFDEARRLDSGAFLGFVASTPDAAVLFVDDGSRDETPRMLADIAARSGGRISVLTLPANRGKAAAIHEGVAAALDLEPEFVGYWDADLATPLSAVGDFLEIFRANPQVDIIMGARVKMLGREIRRGGARHYAGRVFATAASLVLRAGVYDTQCGAKLFRVTDAVRRAFSRPFRTRWIVDVEILARYLRLKGRAAADTAIVEVPLRSWADVGGSKLTVWRALQAAADLASLAWRGVDGDV